MGKVRSAVALGAVLAAGWLVPWKTPSAALAQTQAPAGCTTQPLIFPMQGQYTGPWHSDGDYHFDVQFPATQTSPAYRKDLEMKIVIVGKIDATISADGTISGTATGDVQAPIYHDGQQDISSGIGSISGQIIGTIHAQGATLTLLNPIIDMHWGTFGGHAVETFPHLPNFTFTVNTLDCVSAAGTSFEQGFPVMNITSDGTGQLTQAPGVGSSTGTWQASSSRAAVFTDLSARVDAFIDHANAVLDAVASHPSLAVVDQQIVQPLKALESEIRQTPDVARCLLDRIAAWEAATVPKLYRQVLALTATPTLGHLRQTGDLLSVAASLNLDCQIPDGGTKVAVVGAARTLLDADVTHRDWANAALLAREVLLLTGDAGQAALQTELHQDLQSSLLSAPPADLLDLARISLALGDKQNALAAVNRIPASGHTRVLNAHTLYAGKKRKKGHPARPKPTATPTPPPTPTPRPKSLQQTLSAGITKIQTLKPVGAPPVFSWQPVPRASTYVVAVTAQGQQLLWSWSGRAGTIQYGDTTVSDVPGSGTDAWPVPVGSVPYTWSVIALDGQGRIVGAALQRKP